MNRCDPRLLFATTLFALLAACARQEQAEMSAADSGAEAMSAEVAPLPAMAPADGADAAGAAVLRAGEVDPGQLASRAIAVTDPQRRFVRTAEATFQVKDVYASTLAIEDAVAAEGGFVVSNAISTQTLSERQRAIGEARLLRLFEVATQGNLVVRVPSERTQAFLRTVAKQMQFLDARQFEASDVQFDLLRRQLAQARAQELQRDVRDAGAQPAKTGEKIDAVRAREELLAARDEAAVAQRELEDRIAFSTLTLTLRQPAQVREQIVPDTGAILRERGPGFLSQVREGLRTGWRALLATVVAGVQLWPLWLVAAAAWWLLRRLRRRLPLAKAAQVRESSEA